MLNWLQSLLNAHILVDTYQGTQVSFSWATTSTGTVIWSRFLKSSMALGKSLYTGHFSFQGGLALVALDVNIIPPITPLNLAPAVTTERVPRLWPAIGCEKKDIAQTLTVTTTQFDYDDTPTGLDEVEVHVIFPKKILTWPGCHEWWYL